MVIPYPIIINPASGGPVDLSAGIHIVPQDAELKGVESWLLESLALYAPTLSIGAGLPVAFRHDPGLPVTIDTRGVRADGREAATERYHLVVAADGITITGASAEGCFRGATTLLHMLSQATPGDSGRTTQEIIDAPQWAWRGQSLDVVRTFHPVETVKTVLDLMALYKFNVFHWHLTDSEGWRFPVDQWPNLIEVSGQTARDGRPGGAYTHGDIADVMAYAAARFITVVPEFDSPGHTASVFRAYPELATAEILAMPEAMQYLSPDQPGSLDFVRDVLGAMAEATSGGRIHIGGDEAIAMSEEAYLRFVNESSAIGRETGKGIVAWQEAARSGLQEGDLLQYWIPPRLIARIQAAANDPNPQVGSSMLPEVQAAFIKLFAIADQDVPKALDQGANVIVSRADKLYLDTKYTEPSADPVQEAQRARVGMPAEVYENGTVQDSYALRMQSAEASLTPDRTAGIESCMWCETVLDADDLFFQLLPRLAGVGELGWNGAEPWEEHRARLQTQPAFWEKLGVPYFRSSIVWDS